MSILSNSANTTWLNTHFAGLNAADLDRFINYSTSPMEAVQSLEAKGHEVKYIDDCGKPIFNRSLAYQATQLFEDRAAGLLKQLIQSAFAAPFCWREQALGHYGGLVQPIPIPNDRSAGGNDQALVEVQAEVTLPLPLPSLSPGFSSLLASVRESGAGAELRRAMAQPPTDVTFETQRRAWIAVADELSRSAIASSIAAVSIHKIGEKVVESAAVGALLHSAVDSLSGGGFHLSSMLSGGSYGIGDALGGLDKMAS